MLRRRSPGGPGGTGGTGDSGTAIAIDAAPGRRFTDVVFTDVVFTRTRSGTGRHACDDHAG